MNTSFLHYLYETSFIRKQNPNCYAQVRPLIQNCQAKAKTEEKLRTLFRILGSFPVSPLMCDAIANQSIISS